MVNRKILSLLVVLTLVGGMIAGCARRADTWKGAYSREGRTVILDYEGVRLVFKDILPADAPAGASDSGSLPPIHVRGEALSSGLVTLSIGNQRFFLKHKYKPYFQSNEMAFSHYVFTITKGGRSLASEQGTYTVGRSSKPTITFTSSP